MEQDKRQIIDALVFRPTEAETDKELGRRAYWKAVGILDQAPEARRDGTNWQSDDDPILTVKEKVITYTSGVDSCKLVITNFHQRPPVDRVSSDRIAVEVWPVASNRWSRDWNLENKNILFALTKEGTVYSHLDLVDASIADSILDLFCEDSEPSDIE